MRAANCVMSHCLAREIDHPARFSGLPQYWVAVIIMAHYAAELAVKSLRSSVDGEASQLALDKHDSKQCLTDPTTQIV